MAPHLNRLPRPVEARETTPHIAPVFDLGEALLLRAKQIAHEVEERVHDALQEAPLPSLDSHR